MKTLKNLWAYSKLTATVLVLTTLGWAVVVGLIWWGLVWIGAGLGWVLTMQGITALLGGLFWLIWDAFGKLVK